MEVFQKRDVSNGAVSNSNLSNNFFAFDSQEMSQLDHYDDNYNQGYYPQNNNGYTADIYENNKKRSFQAVPQVSQIQSSLELFDNQKGKKRFVWPESLHRDFVSAVFDVGLKNSSSKLLMQMLPQSRKINPDNVKSHLEKFRMHRHHSRTENSSHYEQSMINEEKGEGEHENAMTVCHPDDVSGSASSSSSARIIKNGNSIATDPLTGLEANGVSEDKENGGCVSGPGGGDLDSSAIVVAEGVRQAALEKQYVQDNLLRLKSQIYQIGTHISEQSAFLFSLKNSISKQTKLHGQLVNKMTQLTACFPSSGSNSNPEIQKGEQNIQTRSNQLSSSGIGTEMSAPHMPHPHQQSIGDYSNLNHIMNNSSSRPQETNSSSSGSSTNGQTGGAVFTARAELQIISEMRAHMDMHRQLLIRKEDQISRHNRDDDTAFDHSQNLSGSQSKAPPHNSRHGWAPVVHGSSKIHEVTGLVLGGEGSELNQEEVEDLTNQNYDSYQHNLNGSSSSGNNSSSHHHQVDSAVADHSTGGDIGKKKRSYIPHLDLKSSLNLSLPVQKDPKLYEDSRGHSLDSESSNPHPNDQYSQRGRGQIDSKRENKSNDDYLGTGRAALNMSDSTDPADLHHNDHINKLIKNSSLNVEVEHDERKLNSMNHQNNLHYNSHQTNNHQLSDQMINYENELGIENYSTNYNLKKHSPHTQDKSAIAESYPAYSSLHPSHNTNINMNEIAHTAANFSRSSYLNKSNHSPTYSAPDQTNQQHINEGKAIAHIEGLNAADWNWDAEDPLDHNLFSFLLDHPIIDPAGNAFPE